MNIVLIDDDEARMMPAQRALEENDHNCRFLDFAKYRERDFTGEPDVIVLDLMGSGQDAEGRIGKDLYDTVWKRSFCPVVVYSGNPDLLEVDHPLVKKIAKGTGSEDRVVAAVESFTTCVTGINKVKTDINSVLVHTLRDSTRYLVDSEHIDNLSEKTVLHLGRRRVAASLDEKSFLSAGLSAWEIYVFPPLATYPQMGDILGKRPLNAKNPESFLLVLTPSCDMVKTSTRKPKVSDVLCAKCESIDVLFSKAQVKKEEDRLLQVLSSGFIQEYLPIPKLSNRIPTMVANMKNVTLIPYDSISNEDANGVDFARIASIDSPFRELISWSYMGTSCRPGLPDRDLASWAKEILS